MVWIGESARETELAPDLPFAGDGLPARDNGPWARDKLSFLDQFVPPALTATTQKRQRFYVDLFAGPGLNIDREHPEEEFEGAALRVLRMTAEKNPEVHFTGAKLVNLSKIEHQALQTRIHRRLFDPRRCPMAWSDIEFLRDDANHVVHRIMRSIHQLAFVLVFADIEAPKQLPFSTVRALKAQGHKSVDLYLLFPLEMAIKRLLSYNSASVAANAAALTTFFGTEIWKELVDRRVTNAQSPELSRAVLDLYREQLKSLGWDFVEVVREVKRRGDAGLYKMIYASNHPAGRDIAGWSAAGGGTRPQLGFDF